MSNTCRICQHPKKLDIERAIISGRAHGRIALQFGVSEGSVRHHAENHISRQLAKAWQLKEESAHIDMLAEIDELLLHGKAIFDRNYEKNHDNVAIKALAEVRQSLDLLAKISFSLHQIKLMEQQEAQKLQDKQDQIEFQNRLQVLSFNELNMLRQLQTKIESQDKSLIIIPDPIEPKVKKYNRRA